MKRLHAELSRVKKQRNRLIHASKGTALDENTHEDLKKIIANEGQKMLQNSNLTSFIFWEQQAEAATKSGCKGMRWHSLMVTLCIIYLRHQSQGAYETLRGCVSLPSQRTLRDYTHHIKAEPGFSTKVDDQLCRVTQL